MNRVGPGQEATASLALGGPEIRGGGSAGVLVSGGWHKSSRTTQTLVDSHHPVVGRSSCSLGA